MKEIMLNESKKAKKIKREYEYDLFLYDDNTNYDNTVVLKQFKAIDEIRNELMIIKKELGFKDTTIDKIMVKDDYLKTKEEKMKTIKTLKCLNEGLKIYDTVYKDDNFIGYTMENKNLEHLNVFDKKRNRIKYLKLIREKIKLLNSIGIFIGNFDEKNFLIDDNDILISNLDNLRIGKFDIDKKDSICKRFEYCCSKKKNIDSYCFNIFTLSFLTNIDSLFLMNNIKDFYLPYSLNTKENRNILDSMKNLDDSYQPKYIIDNMR